MDGLMDTDRDLIVVALQALCRERVNAYNSSFTACSLSGREIPSEEIFGIGEVTEVLRRIGAAPVR